ncbi:transposase [Streptomyces sp. NPDC021749]|uniref:transposase n=1 Tax=Streptomyces sp. NPDC021749 TaxID=3154905 RepID=UPI0033DE1037
MLPSFAARPPGGGTAPCDERAVFTAVVYALTSGCAWRHLPPTSGTSPAAAHRRFTVRTEAGRWRRLRRAVLNELGARDEVDRTSAIVRRMRSSARSVAVRVPGSDRTRAIASSVRPSWARSQATVSSRSSGSPGGRASTSAIASRASPDSPVSRQRLSRSQYSSFSARNSGLRPSVSSMARSYRPPCSARGSMAAWSRFPS